MKHLAGESHQLPGQRRNFAAHRAEHFRFAVTDRVATITLSRPERKNPLTFESYAELHELFRDLGTATDVHAVVLTGEGGNFCSGGDVHEIIGPLTRLDMPGPPRLHPPDRRAHSRHARLSAADRGGDRRGLRGRRRAARHRL